MTRFDPPHEATSAQLLRDRDPAALESFYDANAGRTREYCLLVCRAELIDEATLAAFVDLLGRLDTGDGDGDPLEVLRKATRGAAAGRADVRVDDRELPTARRPLARRRSATGPEEICRAMPELLAGFANGELDRREALDLHMEGCGLCRTTATRFRRAEAAFGREPEQAPPEHVRSVWLEIAGRAAEQNDSGGVSAAPRGLS